MFNFVGECYVLMYIVKFVKYWVLLFLLSFTIAKKNRPQTSFKAHEVCLLPQILLLLFPIHPWRFRKGEMIGDSPLVLSTLFLQYKLYDLCHARRFQFLLQFYFPSPLCNILVRIKPWIRLVFPLLECYVESNHFFIVSYLSHFVQSPDDVLAVLDESLTYLFVKSSNFV